MSNLWKITNVQNISPDWLYFLCRKQWSSLCGQRFYTVTCISAVFFSSILYPAHTQSPKHTHASTCQPFCSFVIHPCIIIAPSRSSACNEDPAVFCALSSFSVSNEPDGEPFVFSCWDSLNECHISWISRKLWKDFISLISIIQQTSQTSLLLPKHGAYYWPTEGAITPFFFSKMPPPSSLPVAGLLPLSSNSCLIDIYSDRRDQLSSHRWSARQKGLTLIRHTGWYPICINEGRLNIR